MKPIGKAKGRGIFLFHKLAQISEWKKDHRWKLENPQVRLPATLQDMCQDSNEM